MRIAAPIAALLLLSLATAEARAQSAAGPPPLCSVSVEGDYARTPANPARVGGSPLYGAARQRRYLETLRGPAGETVTFTRLAAVDSPDGESLIDRYEVRYAGLETPAILHLDWYHYTELQAPQGFTCGQAFNLGIPPPDPFMAAEQLERLAIGDAGRSAGSDRSNRAWWKWPDQRRRGVRSLPAGGEGRSHRPPGG